jgi:UDP-N-acetylmuramyl pentapeptide phosphotransferase/UDP-N-acetylglucosamine-1-phosphate transferase
VSFVDDIRSLPDSVRLVAQFVAMALMFWSMGVIHWDMWWTVVIALIVCVGATNVINFMDGINGITAGYALAVQLAVSLGFIYLCPDTMLAHWIYLAGALVVLALAYVLFKKKYYHLHEEYLASLEK